jgi:uncharacterized membrane protein YraQ (UPF0718 family)
MALIRDKRFILVALLIAAVAGYFWVGSRYPALTDKMHMGTATPISGLAFSTLVKIPPDEKLVPRIFYNTLNWAYTNRQGMTFGVLFGGLAMTLLRLIDRRSFRNRFGDSATGLLIGAPLGVCVNCATPIAKALHTAGASAETALAAMFSSPTLNVIVLTMLFSLFPFYMAAIKVGLTVAFVLIGLPLLTRLLRGSKAAAVPAIPLARIGGGASPTLTWAEAGRWVVTSFGRDLWFVTRTTVPLMLLAGFLGSVLITFLPIQSFADAFPQTGRRAWLGMGGLALAGVFLPVPMTFDVLVPAMLWNAGLSVQYTMVLLFTLGIFSVYPFFVIWKAMGEWMATSLFVGLAGLGIVAGLGGGQYFARETGQHQQLIYEVFGRSSTSAHGPKVLRFGGETRESRPDGELVASLRLAALIPEPFAAPTTDGITVERIPFQTPRGWSGAAAASDKLFTRLEGSQVGLDEPTSFSVLNFEGPFAQFRGIATGDVHNDGWMDILLTSDAGLSLYANRQGRGFVLQEIDIPALKEFHVVNAALVDLNNDGWLDIVFSTFRHGNWLIYNTGGRFTRENLHRLPGPEAFITGAMAFGDVDRDGKLDVVLGSWAPPCRRWGACDEHAFNNVLLRNEGGGRFQERPFLGVPGRQTLSLLLSDIDNDGILDLVVGNEDGAPDVFLLGKGDGTFRQIARADGIIPHSGDGTMSVASADISNELRPSIYVGQISDVPAGIRVLDVGPAICDEIANAGHKKVCQEMMRVHRSMPGQIRGRDVFKCRAADLHDYREDCVAYSLLLWARQQGPEELCDRFPDAWETFRFLCHRIYTDSKEEEAARSSRRDKGPALVDGNHIPVVTKPHNVLLTPTGNGRFADRAVEMGVHLAGFTWNAKFADLDNDGFVDLLAVGGWFPGLQRAPQFFFRNEQGKRFVNQTKEAGLQSFLATSAYSYVDLDNDGDLDLVVVPLVGPPLVYVNNSKANRIAFELRDHVGNRFGIGSKIIIHYGAGGARHQMREIQASGGFLSFDAPIAYFGLGEFPRVERVEVMWSTGERSELRGDFAAGARYILHRPPGGGPPPAATASIQRRVGATRSP